MTPIDLTAYRAELQTATSVLGPQIEGLTGLMKAPLSPQALRAVSMQLTSRKRRLQLIKDVIGAIDVLILALSSLTTDGYPELPVISLQESLFDEIMTELAAMIAAVDIFFSGAISLDIADAVFTKQPPPSA